jgi:hypothetical protein
MTYNLTIFRPKRLVIIVLIITIVSIPLIIAFTFVGLIFLVVLASIIVISFFIGITLLEDTIEILLTGERIQFEENDILLSNIDGYYINRKSPIMIQLEFKDVEGNTYSLTSLNFGHKGNDFKSFVTEFVKSVDSLKKDTAKLSFYDFHPRQYKFANIYMNLLLGVTILLDLFCLYLILFKGKHLIIKMLYLNLIFVGSFSFYKKNKDRYLKKNNR